MLEKFALNQDPFPIVPNGPVHNWAGHEDLREDLVDLVKSVRARDVGVTEFVVIHGEFGAGKSHALRYLRTLIEEDVTSFKSLAIYVDRPRVATKLSFLELHRFIIQEIGRERIQEYCTQISDIFDSIAAGRAEAAGMPNARDTSSFVEAALEQVPSDNRRMIRLLIRGATSIEPVYNFLVGSARCDGDEYDGKIDSDYLASRVLGQLFRVLTDSYENEQSVFESVYLFIDETEVLIEAKASESELIFSGFRELINELPYRFCMVLSYSAPTALIEAVMPNHLMKRMTRPYIEVPILNDEQAVEFLEAQIAHFRIDGADVPNPYYPFEEDSIVAIVEHVTESTPRNLFIQCKRVLERSIRRKGLEPPEVITRDMVDEILGAF